MEVTGEERIAASPANVWAALNNPDILKACVPGCQNIERLSPTELVMTVRVKIGPLPLTFSGGITLANIQAPHRYTLLLEGRGSIAGLLSGRADVTLSPDNDATLLHYDAEAEIGGKLAHMGARLIDSTSSKLSQRFFADLNTTITKWASEGKS